MAWMQFDLHSDQHAPGCRECHSLTACNGKLYLFGGNDQNVRMNEVHCFDNVQMKWSKCDPVGDPPIPRSAHSTTLVKDKILYTFGGWDGNEELGDLHAFDTETKAWSRVLTRGDNPAPRHFHNACKIHNRLYLFGGYDGGAWRNDVVALDLETNVWHSINILGDRPGVRASGACCVFGGDKMLVFGGYDGRDFLSDLWILHTEKDVKAPHVWQQIEKPTRRRDRRSDTRSWPLARSGHSLEAVDSLVVFFGGRYRSGRFNDVYVLNTDTMQWRQPRVLGRCPQARKTHATARLGDRVFVVGGHDGNNWLDDMHLLDIRHIREQCQPRLSVDVPKATFLEDMAGMLEDREDTMADVTFIVEGREVKLHRAILAARSEYFTRMLTNGMAETKAARIPLADVGYDVFIALVRFLYTDQLPSGDTLVLPLLQQAEKFGLPRLSLLCQRQLEAQLDPSNVAELLEAADTHGATPLREACISFILRQFDHVSCTPGFLELRHDLLKTVLVKRAERMPKRPALFTGRGAVLTAVVGGSGSPAAGGAGGGPSDRAAGAEDAGATNVDMRRGAVAVDDEDDDEDEDVAPPVVTRAGSSTTSGRTSRASAGAAAADAPASGAGSGAGSGSGSGSGAGSGAATGAGRTGSASGRATARFSTRRRPAPAAASSSSSRRRSSGRGHKRSGSAARSTRTRKRARVAAARAATSDSDEADESDPGTEYSEDDSADSADE